VLVECGFVRAQASDGSEFSFTPSLGRIAALGSPREIVQVFAGLHGPKAPAEARYVLASLCDQDDPAPLIGWRDESGEHAGVMPVDEQIIIARHLMHHGCVGKSKPEKGDGKYAETFDAAEFISLARVHLGLSSADAEALSMTELQTMLEMKFPDANKRERNVPTREEYDALMARLLKGRSRG
jgi:hypothetical protein